MLLQRRYLIPSGFFLFFFLFLSSPIGDFRRQAAEVHSDIHEAVTHEKQHEQEMAAVRAEAEVYQYRTPHCKT